MATFTVYGASDDLLEFDGDVYAEIDCYDAPAIPILVNDVHMLTIEYGRDGNWRIDVVEVPDGFEVVEHGKHLDGRVENEQGLPRHPAPHGDVPCYSDYLTLTGPIVTVTAYGQTFTANA